MHFSSLKVDDLFSRQRGERQHSVVKNLAVDQGPLAVRGGAPSHGTTGTVDNRALAIALIMMMMTMMFFLTTSSSSVSIGVANQCSGGKYTGKVVSAPPGRECTPAREPEQESILGNWDLDGGSG